MKIEPWSCLSRRQVFSAPPWVELESHHLRLPDGQEIPDWIWIRTPDFVNVVAVTPEGKFVCFRQQKYAAEGSTLAICGGYLDPGESAEQAAQRELREECGLQSDQWTSLGSFAIDGNRGCGTGHLFLAENCEEVGGKVDDDLEDQQLLLLSVPELREALHQGAFKVIPWTAALAMSLLRMDEKQKEGTCPSIGTPFRNL